MQSKSMLFISIYLIATFFLNPAHAQIDYFASNMSEEEFCLSQIEATLGTTNDSFAGGDDIYETGEVYFSTRLAFTRHSGSFDDYRELFFLARTRLNAIESRVTPNREREQFPRESSLLSLFMRHGRNLFFHYGVSFEDDCFDPNGRGFLITQWQIDLHKLLESSRNIINLDRGDVNEQRFLIGAGIGYENFFRIPLIGIYTELNTSLTGQADLLSGEFFRINAECFTRFGLTKLDTSTLPLFTWEMGFVSSIDDHINMNGIAGLGINIPIVNDSNYCSVMFFVKAPFYHDLSDPYNGNPEIIGGIELRFRSNF